VIKIINLENLNKIIKTYFDRIVEDRNEADKIWLHLNHLKNEMEQIYTSYSNIADKAIITGEIVDRLAEYEDTGLYSRGDISMVFAEIERLQAENTRLKAERDSFEYELLAVMHSVDKWLEGKDLKDNPATRAGTAREVALRAIEKVAAERDKAVEDMRRCRRNKCDYCYYSNKNQNTPCRDCQSPISNCGDKWQWRGLEESE